VKFKFKKGSENDPKAIKEVLTRISKGNSSASLDFGIESSQHEYLTNTTGEGPSIEEFYKTEEGVLTNAKDTRQEQL
jgi:hypothetical protein